MNELQIWELWAVCRKKSWQIELMYPHQPYVALNKGKLQMWAMMFWLSLLALLSGSVNGALLSQIIEHPENRMEISHNIRQLNAEKIGGDEADLNKLRNIFMSILKDIKADYDNVPQDIGQTEFQEMLTTIKAQSDDIHAKRPITETNIANITASVLSGVDALDEAEILMFYELSKHLLERMSGGCDWENGGNMV